MVAFPCAAFAHIRLTNQRFAYDDPGDWATHAWEVLNARGIVVYEHKNDLTGLVTVTEHARRWRALRFNGNIQSITRVVWKQDSPSVLFAHGCVLNEYVKVMASSLFSFNSASICQPRLQCDMLFLGLGAGTLPMFCVEHMTHATLTAVEFDPVVVQTAREFAGLSGNVPVLIGDAAQILQGLADNSEATQLYDAICVDVFDGDNLTPVPCRDAVFVRNVYRALRDDGVVVINCHTNSVTASPVSGSNAVSAVDVVFQQTLKIYMDAFPNVYCVPVRFTGNTIIVAHKSCRALERSEILEAARKAAREIGARFDFCRLLKDITRTNP
jgi:spermidine synthase